VDQKSNAALHVTTGVRFYGNKTAHTLVPSRRTYSETSCIMSAVYDTKSLPTTNVHQ